MKNILKNCQKCGLKFQINEDDLLPIEGHVDYGYDEKDLEFICRCQYCGEINTLSIEEQSKISIETMKKLMEKYAYCSNKIKRIWLIEAEEKLLIQKLAMIEREKNDLQDRVNFAMHNVDKDCLYNHWPLTSEIIRNEEQKRKKLK